MDALSKHWISGESEKKKPLIGAALSLGRKRPARASQHLCCTANVLLIAADFNVKIAAGELMPRILEAPLPRQNPTTATMSAARRAAIAEVIRHHRLPVIEDDAYGMLPGEPLAPLGAAPDLDTLGGALTRIAAAMGENTDTPPEIV
jgi:hypothetical protein